MQFGGTKYISGEVPWDSTTNSNRLQLTAYPFTNVESGSIYSLQGTYQGAGANIQITDGTFTTLDELDMTFDVPSEMIGQINPSFILMFEDPEENRDYFVYDVAGLTLEPAPAPFELVAYDAEGVQFTKAQLYSSEGTITGPTGGGGTDYYINYPNFNFNFNSNYPFVNNQYYMAIKANLPFKITLNNVEYNFDVLVNFGGGNSKLISSDISNKIGYYWLNNQSNGSSVQIGSIVLKDTVKNQQKTLYIYFNTASYQSDTRQDNPGEIRYLQEGSYNSLPITDYFTRDNAANIVSKNVNGNNYFFVKISNPENVSTEIPAIFSDVTNDITGTTLLSTDKVYRGDFKELTVFYTDIYLGGTSVYKSKNYSISNFGLTFSNTPLYANDLNSRNIGIEPLSSSDKAIGTTNDPNRTLGSYTDISFTAIDPSTATVTTVDNVKNINISLTGTLNKFTSGANSVTNINYEHCYKPWPMSYSGPDNRNYFNLDANYYFLIIKLTDNWKYSRMKIKYYFSDGTNYISNYFEFQTTPNGEALFAFPCTDTKYPIALETTIDDASVPTVKYNFDWTNITFAT